MHLEPRGFISVSKTRNITGLGLSTRPDGMHVTCLDTSSWLFSNVLGSMSLWSFALHPDWTGHHGWGTDIRYRSPSGLLAVLAFLGGLQFRTPLALEAFALLCPQLAWQVLKPNWCQVATLSHVMCLFCAFFSHFRRKTHGQFQARSTAHSCPWENVTRMVWVAVFFLAIPLRRFLLALLANKTALPIPAFGKTASILTAIGESIFFIAFLWRNLSSTICFTPKVAQTASHIRVVGDKSKTTRGQLGDHIRRLLGENIWETAFGQQVETSARRLGDEVPRFHKPCRMQGERRGKVEIPPSAPRDWNEVKTKWETHWQTKLGDKVEEEVQRETQWETQWADTWETSGRQGGRHSGRYSGRRHGRGHGRQSERQGERHRARKTLATSFQGSPNPGQRATTLLRIEIDEIETQQLSWELLPHPTPTPRRLWRCSKHTRIRT